MGYLVDIGEAVDAYVQLVGENASPLEIEKNINTAIAEQINMVIDYVDGLAEGDYDKTDLQDVWESGHLSVANCMEQDCPDAVLNSELFEVLVGQLIAKGDPLNQPVRLWRRTGNLLLVRAIEDGYLC